MNIRLYKVSVFFLVFSVLESPKGYTQIDREAGSMFQTRLEVIGQRGMVATSQPLATQMSLQILRNGGIQ